MGVFNRNGEALGRSRHCVGDEGKQKVFLVKLYFRYLLDIHENIKFESPLNQTQE